MKCGKPYCVCVGQCFAQQSPLNNTSGGSMTTEAERLAKVFTYDKETGELTWSVAAGNGRIKEGTPAGSMSNNGYLRVMLGKKSHQVHKLAWLLSYGEFPSGTVHHIDGNKANNRLANLKLHTATPSKELKKARDMTDVELLDYLRVNLTYIDGCLYWKTSNSKRVAGKRVGSRVDQDVARQSERSLCGG